MNTIVILYDENNKYESLELVQNKNALLITKEVFLKAGYKEDEIKSLNGPLTLSKLLEAMCDIAAEAKAENIIFSFADCPLMNEALCKKLLDTHIKYKAEYTFADGYSYGFAPEIINSGSLNILKELSKSSQTEMGNKKVNRESLFDLIKTDINSFEIETVISDSDWRMNRFAFHCGKYENYLSCRELLLNKNSDDAEELCLTASKLPAIIKTRPAFYNIQVCDKINISTSYSPYESAWEKVHGKSPLKADAASLMPFEKFSALIDRIADFSKEAVISLSAWGEAFNHPDILKFIEKVLSYEGLSVYIESDGLNISEEAAEKIAGLLSSAKERSNGWPKFMLAITLDAFTKEKYHELHSSDAFEKAVENLSMLEKYLPSCVYPSFTRINQNEEELEAFFRFWDSKESPSKGELIIQKYDNFAGLLEDLKPADLSPLERNVCWHLRRDMTIYSNGDVPLCRTCLYSNIIGNVFTEDLCQIWKKSDSILEDHMKNNYNQMCRKCDEYYTFNF